MHLLGRVLLAILVAVLVTITTVSSIQIIPVVYWAIAGIVVNYNGLAWVFAAKLQEADLLSYRLAFDMLPVLPTQHLAFSTLTTHRIVCLLYTSQ